ncbi:hemerythrin domain-containing protein [Asticcacaulis sp. ZE23SCel15]|uniref:hemerythrin domain-containing protein n=1 Tax=Asticcacaulis sp. ZE23SCel15 TaxID=3059027 RepID=UPI00265DA0E5|nr:hemerythrin domain-containing protein [Asticcacaulis sp. ZE23SCel15]WKL57773.1 hemerythrin domain-containing protein [Asticcacaulis sp. ZE23SCel15]
MTNKTPTKSALDIFTALIADHNKHRKLLDKIEAADKDARLEHFAAFALEAKAHAAAEEQALYSVMMANPDLTSKARHSVAEHKEIEDLIDEIAELDAGSKAWSEKFSELKHEYLHHIEEEEEEMFPAADEELTKTEERDMGKVFKDRKPKEKAAATVGEE